MSSASQESDPPILIGALPDLVIGLVGIPAALSLANIVQFAFSTNFLKGVQWFLLMGAFYAMYPYWYLLFFDVLQIRDGKNWYKYNIWWLLYLTVLAFVSVGCILALGNSFESDLSVLKLETDTINQVVYAEAEKDFSVDSPASLIQSRQKYYYLFYILIFLSAHFPIIFGDEVLDILRGEHLHLSGIYLVTSLVIFVLSVVILLG